MELENERAIGRRESQSDLGFGRGNIGLLNGWTDIHQILRVTPAVAAGVSNNIWEISELITSPV